MTPAAARPSVSAGIALTAAANLAPPLSALVTAPLLARALGVSGRGAVAAVVGVLALLVVLGGLGVPEALTHYVAARPAAARRLARRATGVLALSGVVLTVALAFGGPALLREIPDAGLLFALAAAGLAPALGVAVLRAVAAGRGQWGRVALERVVSSLARLLLTVVPFATGRLTVTVATAVLVASPVLGALAYVGRAHNAPPLAPQAVLPDAEAPTSRLVSFGARVWFGAVAGILLLRLDQAVMVPLSDAVALGLYVVAVSVGEVPLVLNTAVRDVLFSAESAAADDARLARAARASFLVVGAVTLVLALPAPWWVPLLFGRDFAGAVPATLLLLAAAAISPPGSVAGAGLSARGRPDLRSWSLVAALAVNVVALVALVPRWGATGAAVATLLGSAVASHLNVLHVRRRHGIPVRSFYAVSPGDVRFVVATGAGLVRSAVARRP